VRVQVGIDAAITANHHVAVRSINPDGTAVTSRFVLAPTLSGLNALTRRLGAYPGVVAVAEPTSMTWLRRCATAAGSWRWSGPGTPRGCAGRSAGRTSPTSSTPTCWPAPGRSST